MATISKTVPNATLSSKTSDGISPGSGGGVLGISGGGTGLSTLGLPDQLLRVNATQTALEYFTSVSAILSITGSANINVSGGLNPVISLTSQVPITNGGTGLSTVGTAGQVLTSNGTSLVYTTPGSSGGTFTSSNVAIPSLVATQTSNSLVTTGVIQITQPSLTANIDSRLLVLGADPVDNAYIAYREDSLLPFKQYMTLGTSQLVPKIEIGPSIKIIDTTDPTTTTAGVLNILNPNALVSHTVRLVIGKNNTDYGYLYWTQAGGSRMVISSDSTNQSQIEVSTAGLFLRGFTNPINITGSDVSILTNSLPLGNPNLFRDANGILTSTPPTSGSVTPLVLFTSGTQVIAYSEATLRYVNNGRTLEIWFHLEGQYNPSTPTNIKIQATIPGGWLAKLGTVVDFTADSAVTTVPVFNWGYNVGGYIDTNSNTIDFFVYSSTVDTAPPAPVYLKPTLLNTGLVPFRYKGHASILIS